MHTYPTEEARLHLLATAITTLPQVRGDSERELILTIRTLRRSLAVPTQHSGLHPFAQKMLDKLGDKSLHVDEWAEKCKPGMKGSSGTFKLHRRTLEDLKLIEPGESKGHWQRAKGQPAVRIQESAEISKTDAVAS